MRFNVYVNQTFSEAEMDVVMIWELRLPKVFSFYFIYIYFKIVCVYYYFIYIKFRKDFLEYVKSLVVASPLQFLFLLSFVSLSFSLFYTISFSPPPFYLNFHPQSLILLKIKLHHEKIKELRNILG